MLDTKTIDEKRGEWLHELKKCSYDKLMELAEEDISCDTHDAVSKILKYGCDHDVACMLKLFIDYQFADNMISMPK